MNNWKKTTLKDVAEKIAMGPFGSNIKVETFVEDGIPVISGQHLKGIKLIDNDYNYVTEEHANKLKNSLVYRGDVIFTHAGNIGQVAYIPEDSKYEKYIISQRQFYLRCNKEKLNPKFITYFFKSRYGQYKLLANANQVGVPSISQPSSYLKSLAINLPLIEEQKEIAAVLSSLDDKIELLCKENETLEKIAQRIFKEWFVNFKIDGKKLKLKNGIPEGWRIGKIYETGKVVCGKTPSKENSDYFGGKIPFIKIPDMHGQMFLLKTIDKLSKNGVDSQKTKTIPKNSICVSCIATVGLVSITTEDSQTNQQINSVVPNNEYLVEYLYFSLKSISGFLNSIGSSGTTTANVNTGTFMNLEILIPAKEYLLLFHKTTGLIFSKIKDNNFQIQTLSRLRDTLLPKLMSGEVKM